MKRLALSKDGSRFTLTIPASLPLRAAACAIRGAKTEGGAGGLAVYSYPSEPDVCAAILETFSPEVDRAAGRLVSDLLAAQAALVQAMSWKEGPAELQLNPLLQTKPMAHQVQAINFCGARADAGAKGTALLMEQGTGKTLVAVAMANHWHRLGRIRWVLVIAPNSLKGTWGGQDGEILAHCLPQLHPGITILRGTKPRRLEQLQRAMARTGPDDSLQWVVTNYDQFAVNLRKRTAAVREFMELLEMVKQVPPGMLILDESSEVKTHTAQRTMACLLLSHAFPLRMILTGTPLTKSPLDLWSQFELVEEGCLGFNTYMAFEKAYAVRKRMKSRDGSHTWIDVVAFQHLEDLEQRVARLSFRALAKDCLDLPPVSVKRLDVELSAAQGTAIRELKSDMMTELESGQYVDGRNILVRYGKMAEIGGGWVHTLNSDGTKAKDVEAFIPNPRLDALTDYLGVELRADPTRKVVIFCQHTAEVSGVVAALKQWGAVRFDGTIKEKEREENRLRFNTMLCCRAFVAQYRCGSMGLNLTVADTLVFYSLTFGYGEFAQASKRVNRKGQTAALVKEVYLLARVPSADGKRFSKSLDHIMLTALRDKKDLADIVTGDAARALLEEMGT